MTLVMRPRRDTCKRGHPLSEAYITVTPKGVKRICRKCRYFRHKAHLRGISVRVIHEIPAEFHPTHARTSHIEWMRRIAPLRAPGVTNKEIAQQLGTTHSLVSRHIRKAGLYSLRQSAFCPNGHRYDQAGHYYDGRAARRCKACRRAQWQKERQRKIAAGYQPKPDDKYTEAEITLLRRLAATGYSRREIAEMVPGRSLYSIKHKLMRLGIKTSGHLKWKRALPADAFKSRAA